MNTPGFLPEGATYADLLAATVAQLADGVVVVDLKGKVQVLNRAAEATLGGTIPDVTPEQWSATFGIHLPDGVTLCPPSGNPLGRALRGEDVRDAEVVVKNSAQPDGARYTVSASPVRDERGTLRGGISIFRDITDRRRDEESRIRRFSALLELTRREPLGPEGLQASLDGIVRGAAAALGVDRVGLWRFTPERSALTCSSQFDGQGPRRPEERVLSAEDFPLYLKALRESNVVDAGDAARDPRTLELAQPYLAPLGIGALLDAPIFVRGELEGILCHEHRGSTRVWTAEEKTMAVAIANLAARAIAESERHQLRDALRASEEARLQMEERGGTRYRFKGLIGRSARMTEVFRRLRLAAESNVTVLLTGESGTGKELSAAAVHSLSARSGGPFIAINCAALPEPLLESELFGHVRGAFTGAEKDRTGLFQAANGGTLFLDEVGDLSPALQVKVLRALQEREVRRVGDNRPSKVDVRIVAATNRDLDELLAQEKMREDFYYRIRVFEIRLPPLRERREDIPILAAQFVREFSQATGKRVKTISPAAMRQLLEHSWPGNVRELRNAVEHAFVLSSGPVLEREDLPPGLDPVRLPPQSRKKAPSSPRDVQEIQRIRKALDSEEGNRTRAARSLGMSRVTLWHKMKKYGIDH